MNTADFIRGLDILMDYYDKRDSYHLGAEHDVIYAYATDRPLSPGDLQRVIDFGFHQEEVCYHQGSALVAQSVPTPLRDPTSEELESPLFNAIWKAIKGWDLRRENAAGYAGATGTDVCTILDAIKPAAQSVPTLLLEALENIEALSHRPEGVDFDNPIEQLRSVHEIAVVTLNVKRTSRRCPECDQSGFHKMSCDTRDKETL